MLTGESSRIKRRGLTRLECRSLLQSLVPRERSSHSCPLSVIASEEATDGSEGLRGRLRPAIAISLLSNL